MIDLNITFFIQLINFLIILFVLNFLLYKPIRGIIKKRTELMAGQLNDIEKFNSQAETKLVDYEAALNEARKQGKDIRGNYREEGYVQEKAVIESAQADAAAKLKEDRAQIEKNKSQAMQSLKSKIDAYAKMATEKVLGRA
ncbi:MAG: ATP synthase F0 subunit B [Desulfovibrionales bacterium]